MVAGVHMNGVPPTIAYASVLSHETTRVALKIMTLNNMSVKTPEIMNAYIKAPHGEKVYIIHGPEFGTY